MLEPRQVLRHLSIALVFADIARDSLHVLVAVQNAERDGRLRELHRWPRRGGDGGGGQLLADGLL